MDLSSGVVSSRGLFLLRFLGQFKRKGTMGFLGVALTFIEDLIFVITLRIVKWPLVGK